MAPFYARAPPVGRQLTQKSCASRSANTHKHTLTRTQNRRKEKDMKQKRFGESEIRFRLLRRITCALYYWCSHRSWICAEAGDISISTYWWWTGKGTDETACGSCLLGCPWNDLSLALSHTVPGAVSRTVPETLLITYYCPLVVL